MSCERYHELLSARLDRELTQDEAEELELHLVGCPKCRIVGEQMEEVREAFADLEEVPAPEGFAQGVMDRIRAGESGPKVIPLFKRPQFKALAGLAACLALVVGLYSAARPHHNNAVVYIDITEINALCEDFDANDSLQSRSAPGEEDAPMIASYDGTDDVEAPVTKAVERLSNRAVLVLERMPEGGADLIPPETVVTYNPATGEEGYTWLTEDASEALAQIEQLAVEQGMSAERSSFPEEAQYDLVLLTAYH